MEAAIRVAKNMGILYARMAITVFISLYSTRLILAALGVEDFGLFNLVGGVITMLGFLNSSMAAATQRFMSFAQGSGDLEKVKRIFNMSSLLHGSIAVLVFLFMEGAGYFFFHGILNIAPERLQVANLIYQFMVISTLFTVISVPYEAVITSHENMLVYAVMGVIEAILKLGIAFYITYSGMDHLVIYGILMAALSILLLIIKRIYCHRVYEECQLQIRHYYDKPLLKEMSGFAGWSLLVSSSGMIANYGSTIIINIFFGTILNAAQSLVSQISGQLSVLGSTMSKAINPLIDKSMGSGNRKYMLNVSLFSTKISFFLLSLTYLPFLVQIPLLLKLWLKVVPAYTVIFCVFQLIRNLIEQLYITLTLTIAAEGNIRSYSIYSSLITLFPLPVSYILFKLNYPPYYLYVTLVIYAFLYGMIVLYFVIKISQLSLPVYLREVFARCTLSFLIALTVSYCSTKFYSNQYMGLFISTSVGIISLIIMIWFLGLNREEKMITRGIFAFYFNKRIHLNSQVHSSN